VVPYRLDPELGVPSEASAALEGNAKEESIVVV
jgi:hypothetical protein